MSLSDQSAEPDDVSGSILLSIVVPTFNEAASVAPLRVEIDAAMADAPYSWEAVWIDDGSTDETSRELRDFDAPHRYLRFEQNCGQSAALMAGIYAARGEWVGTLDGDGQNDPQDLPRQLTFALEAGLDMVNGIRAKRNDSLVRRVSSRLANGYRRRLLKDGVTDVGCSTRVVRRAMLSNLPFFDGIHRYLPALVAMRGGTMGEIPVNHRPRTAGKSKYGIRNRLWVGLQDVRGVRWLRDRNRRWTIIEQTPDRDQECG